MAEYRFTEYFENEVLQKRSYLRKEWCIHVIDNAVRCERQEDNRMSIGFGLPFPNWAVDSCAW